MWKSYWKVGLCAILIAVSFGAGMLVSNWHHDSIELVAQKAAKKSADNFQVEQSQIADGVQKSLDEWRQNNVIIQEKITREKLQPVFSTVCVTDDYIRMFNEQTKSKSTSRTVKPSAKAGN